MRDRIRQPGGRAPAPGELGTVQSFVNTLNVEAGVELFETPSAASDWLVGHGLTGQPDSVADYSQLRRIVDLREALRDLLIANHDGISPPAEAMRVISPVTVAGSLVVSANDVGDLHVVATDPGLDGALARIVLFAVAASTDGRWRRLKVCNNVGCRWAFWDSSRNRSGRWCTMSLCGNQAKVRAYRSRAVSD